jgi:tetratricopeptide (TPR) repeat protein
MFHHGRLRTRLIFSLLLATQLMRFSFAQAVADQPSQQQPISIASLGLTSADATALQNAISAHDYPAAEKTLLAAINHDSHSPRAAHLFAFAGTVYFLNGDYPNAAIAWKKSEAIAPLEPALRFSLAMAYIRMGHALWSQPVLQALAKDQPTNALYPYWLGRLDYDAQLYHEAIAHFQQAVALAPTMARAYDNLGLCYFYENYNTLAIESYTKAIELDRNSAHPSPWPHLNLAVTLMFLNRLDEAEVHLREAIRLDPALAPAHYQLGLVLEDRNHADDAIHELHTSIQLDAHYAEPHFALARIYHKLGRNADAQAEVQIFLSLHSTPHPVPGSQDH